jgi:exopolyphosphatase/guanosine-5'-triphosphate,3'-diphosphate pyrophosphatase
MKAFGGVRQEEQVKGHRAEARRGRSRRRPDSDAAQETFAAIDLGTNNCRLLIARRQREGFRVVDAFSRIVRLGEGLSRSGGLSEAAMQRTLDALMICAEKMARRGVTRSRSVATEACRRAANHGAFLERVRRETGVRLEIISSDEEARLAMLGCQPLFDRERRFALLFDIGGGSTEISWVETNPERPRAPQLKAWFSLPYGVVNLAERHCDGAVARSHYEVMTGEVLRSLETFEAREEILELIGKGQVQMLGTSGTVTTLAGVHMRLPRYQRSAVDGCYLDFASLESVIDRIAGMEVEERASHPCIGPDRADLMLAGCAILQGICRTWPVGRLRVADRGLREGILLGLMKEQRASRPCAAEGAGQARP